MRAVVALGSSVPPAIDRVERAFQTLAQHPDLTLVSRSDVMMTPAAGGATLDPFANAACVVETAHGPAALLRLLHVLESNAGRLRTRPLGPRCLDLDLIDVPALGAWRGAGISLPHPGRDRPYARAVIAQALARAS